MTALRKEDVMKALAGVIDPARGRDIMSLGMVQEVAIDGGTVSFAIEVDPARGNELEPLRQAAQAAVEKLSGAKTVLAVLTAERAAPPKLNVRGTPQTPTHKISQRPVAPKVKHMIAVASGKGGVGKSTVAANLALSFAALGKKTGLLDADIYGSSQPLMMGLRQKPETNADDMILPLVAHGVKFMSMGFFVEPDAPVIWRGPMVHSAIQQLLRDVEWGDLDILVIDLPPGTGDAQLSMAQYVPLSGAVIVSTPQDVALNEAKKGLKMFEKTGVDVLGIVENMSYHSCSACGHREDIFGHGGAKKAAADLKVEFLGDIPLVKTIREDADNGKPFVAAHASHDTAENFRNIAARVWMKLPDKRPPDKSK
ncbi:MAG: Mrp/NBP35 family ATP-binding protein [Alphaproteobacteria bacterium]|nr:Mrp/NBP35 family ATP-binding protein [Alphaproteobacteria bacterium]